jgi:hypothetical protein
MAGEEWARRIVAEELKRTVSIHDNGSAPGMYDLRIGPAHAPEVAIECVGAVDPAFTETWNIGPAKGSMQLSITGDWTITITPKARVKKMMQDVERLLRELEHRGIYNVPMDYGLRYDAELSRKLESLGITQASCYRQQGTGQIYLSMPGIGGAANHSGAAIPGWVGDFLRDTERQDVLSKLAQSGATERHAFLFVSFAGAPWPVESYLSGELDQHPGQEPDLPPPVNRVWIVWTHGGKGLRWDGTTWHVFAARGEGIDV